MIRNYKSAGLVTVLLSAVLVAFADPAAPKPQETKPTASPAPGKTQKPAAQKPQIPKKPKPSLPKTEAKKVQTPSPKPADKPSDKGKPANNGDQPEKSLDGSSEGNSNQAAVKDNSYSMISLILNIVTLLGVGLISFLFFSGKKKIVALEESMESLKSASKKDQKSANTLVGIQSDLNNMKQSLKLIVTEAIAPLDQNLAILGQNFSAPTEQRIADAVDAARNEQANADQEEFSKQLGEEIEKQKAEDAEELAAQLAAQKTVYEKQLQEKHTELEKQRGGYEDKLAAQKTANEKQLAELKAGHEKQLAEQKAGYEQKLQGKDTELNNQKADYEKQLAAKQTELGQQKTKLDNEWQGKLDTKSNEFQAAFPPVAWDFRAWVEKEIGQSIEADKKQLIIYSFSRLEILSHKEDKKPCYDDLLRFDTLLWDAFGSDKADADLGILKKLRDKLEALLNENVLKDTDYHIEWAKAGTDINGNDSYRIVDNTGCFVRVAINGLVTTKNGKVLQRSKVICDSAK